MKNFFRNVLTGDRHLSDDYATYRRMLLVGSLCFVSLIIGFFYLIATFRIAGLIRWQYLVIIVISLSCLLLNRRGKSTLAMGIQLIMGNVAIFYFATLVPNRLGTHLLFISCSLGAFAFFGYRQRTVAFLFMVFSSVLFLISYFGFADTAAKSANIFFVFNFFTAVSVSALVIYFIFRLNYYAETQLTERNDQLTKANHELDRFVYSASHDLQAPLSSLLGLIEITQQAKDPQELKLCLDMMSVRVNDLDQFIKEVIDYSRNSRQEVNVEKFDLKKLAHEVVEGLKFTQGFEDIHVNYEISDDELIHTDRARLKIILSNLVGNAMKYHDILKANKNVSVSAKQQAGEWCIIITDNGIGIPAAYHEKIFTMFFRASEKSSGSGLGLYIVRETALKLGGLVTVNSEPGKGSVFTVVFPAA